MFTSILCKDYTKEELSQWEEPVFFNDLNLRQLVTVIANEYKDTQMIPYFYDISLTQEEIFGRHAVLTDLKKDSLLQAVYDFCIMMRQVKRNQRLQDEVSHPLQIQKQCWCLNAVLLYTEGVIAFSKALQKEDLTSDSFCELRNLLFDYTNEKSFQKMYQSAIAAKEELEKINYTIEIKKNQILILPSNSKKEYSQKISEFFGYEGQSRIDTLLEDKLELLELERDLLICVKKRFPETIAKLEQFSYEIEGIILASLERFYDEVPFYLAYIRFQKDMERFSFSFCIPEFQKSDIEIEGLYDLALAHKNAYEGKEVVCNDMRYSGKELFSIVTGPNQGGKTTFARAIGQIVYFSKIGLPVPASTCHIPYFTGIMTHFEVEESMMSGEGKLKEELSRLRPMFHESDQNHFIIINELFTTAATYDARIMGKRVLEHFIQDHCYGIYVTHIKELAEETDQIVSLVAQLDEKSRARTFQIVRKTAEGTGHVSSLVERYRLSYEDLMERLI